MFSSKVAHEVYLWSSGLEAYCMQNCYCANNDDEYYHAALRERIFNLNIKDLDTPSETLPNGVAPTQTPRPDQEDGVRKLRNSCSLPCSRQDPVCSGRQSALPSRISKCFCPPLRQGQQRYVPIGVPTRAHGLGTSGRVFFCG